MKAQWVRLADVFVVGPVMLAGARYAPDPWLRLALAVFGGLTITYNAANWLKGR